MSSLHSHSERQGCSQASSSTEQDVHYSQDSFIRNQHGHPIQGSSSRNIGGHFAQMPALGTYAQTLSQMQKSSTYLDTLLTQSLTLKQGHGPSQGYNPSEQHKPPQASASRQRQGHVREGQASHAEPKSQKRNICTYLDNPPSSSSPLVSKDGDPRDIFLFYLFNIKSPRGQYWHTEAPASVTSTLHPLRKPRAPAIAAATLALLQPWVFFVQFGCHQRCRSMGICIHFQFVLGVQRCPDGLICRTCKNCGPQKEILAERRCPLHQKQLQPKHIGSRPEDFLATDQQRERCIEILQRSIQGRWDDLENIRRDKGGVGDDGDATPEGSQMQLAGREPEATERPHNRLRRERASEIGDPIISGARVDPDVSSGKASNHARTGH